MVDDFLDRWHKIFISDDISNLPSIIAEDAVFHSPIVHTPQRGKKLVLLYLTAAHQVLKNDKFEYLRKFDADHQVVLNLKRKLMGLLLTESI